MRRTFLKGVAAVAAVAAVTGGAAFAQESAEEFYDGNVIRWIVPYSPGGGYDEYSRMLMPYFEEATGSRVDIVNMPGSGGMRGAVEIFNSPDDGTTVGIINGSAMVTNQLADISGADYRIGEYSYLGRIVADTRVMVAGANSGLEDFEDLRQDGQTLVVGATGLGGSTYVDAVIVGEAFNFDQNVVHGFNSSGDIRTAMLRGDIQGMWGSLGSAIDGIDSGDHHVVLHSVREPEGMLADVPSVWDRVSEAEDPERAQEILEGWDALSAVGRPVAGPPGIPEERLSFLQDAFEQAMNDPDFVSEIESAQRDLSYASGQEMVEIARAATELSPDVEELFIRAIQGEI